MKTTICLSLLVIFMSFISVEASEARTWTSKSGAKVTASFVKKSGSYVTLKKEDGSPIRISVYKLSKADQEYIKSMTQPKPAAAKPAASSAPTEGTASITLTTQTTKDKYSPKNFIAIWVTDEKNKIVKPLLLHGSKKSQSFLKKWQKAAKKLDIAASSGATLKGKDSYTHTVNWDCKTASGETAPDGIYNIMIEFAEGPKGQDVPNNYISFKKGPEAVSLNPKDRKYITDISIKYTPAQ